MLFNPRCCSWTSPKEFSATLMRFDMEVAAGIQRPSQQARQAAAMECCFKSWISGGTPRAISDGRVERGAE